MSIMRYVMTSWIGGILFWIMDGIINGNPYAKKLYKAFRSSTDTKISINITKSFFVYLVYGCAMVGIFSLLYKSLPGKTGISKGLSFGIMVWFFRGFMTIMSQWTLYTIPINSMAYWISTGIFEGLIIGTLFGLLLKRESTE